MKALLLTLALALLASSSASAGELYRCSAKAVVAAASDGSATHSTKDPLLSTWGRFFVDTDTGLVRIARIVVQRWDVIQKGSAENDFVAAPTSDPGVAPLYVLRLRMAADMPHPTFIMLGLSEMTTGTCEPVR